MRKELIGAVSACALLMGGAAWAQDSQPSTTATEPPAASGTTATTTTTTTAPAGDSASPSVTEPQPEMGSGTTMERQETTTVTTEPSADPAAPTTSTSAAMMDRTSAEQLIGKTVVGAAGEEIGEVEDVLIDAQTGNAQQLVISSGGFLGIGGKSYAVDLQDAQIEPGADEIALSSMSKDQIEAMPEFEYDEATVSLRRVDQPPASSTTGTTDPGSSATEPGRTTTGTMSEPPATTTTTDPSERPEPTTGSR